MRVVVTRPQADGERTAQAFEARGHDVLLAPLMRVETLAADLSGEWAGVIVTSGNALAAIEGQPQAESLRTLPLFAVGRRSAAAARGFAAVHSADGDVRDLVALIAREHRGDTLLYLAGEDRAADLVGELARAGIRAEMRIVYRAATERFPPILIAALEAGDVDAVLHYSRRSAEYYLQGAHDAGILEAALAVTHACLSPQVAEPLRAAGVTDVRIASRPEEAAMLGLLDGQNG
jgi:uroporphyrinogen-III synthase